MSNRISPATMAKIIIPSFIVTFGLTEVITRNLGNPSEKTLLITNGVAGTVHLALAAFMFFYTPALDVGLNVDFKVGEKILFGTIDSALNVGYRIKSRGKDREIKGADVKSHAVPTQNAFTALFTIPTAAGDSVLYFDNNVYASGVVTSKEVTVAGPVYKIAGKTISESNIAKSVTLQDDLQGRVVIKDGKIMFTARYEYYDVEKEDIIAGGWRVFGFWIFKTKTSQYYRRPLEVDRFHCFVFFFNCGGSLCIDCF